MQLGDLSRYGISEQMIEAWRKRQGESLLPIQRRAIRQGLLEPSSDDQRRNLIISAPTSAGKSFCAEMAAARVLARQWRVVMLFPLRSLAEEKFRLFDRTYGPLGVKCLLVTGDYPENDQAFTAGDYHIALAIHEKFDLALVSRLDILCNIGLIVIDEIQMISEPGRGAVLERLLTRILASTYAPEIIGLSAVLAERRIEPLAEWLKADIVEETIRPRDLIRGVAAQGRLTYRSYNDGCDGSEPFEDIVTLFDSEQSVAAFAERLKVDGGRTLIFLKSRADSVSLALKLAAALNRPAAAGALKRLADEEPSFLLRSLTQALSHGTAFHNSDLAGHHRAVVEQAFAEGEVSVLCSTTTLALGVNLPADVVYLETVKYASGAYDSRPELVPISRAEFDNMTGRAGRLGYGGDKPGRAVVMAESSFDSEVLWDAYIAPVRSEPIRSAWTSLPETDWVLHMIVCGLARGENDLQKIFAHTLYYRLSQETDVSSDKDPLPPTFDRHRESRPRFGDGAWRPRTMLLQQFGDCRATTNRLPADVSARNDAIKTLFQQADHAGQFESALARLHEYGLIERHDNGGMIPTPAGAAAAGAGLSVAETRHYLQMLRDHELPETMFGWTCVALSSTEWTLPPAILSWYEQANNTPVRMLYERFDHSLEEAVRQLPAHHRRQPLTYRTSATLKAALLLDQWCRLTAVQKLEERFHLHLGQIQQLGRTAAHLTAALGRLIAAIDRESEKPGLLTQHAFSLRTGLPASYQPLHARLGGVLGRSDFLRLHDSGVESLEELATYSQEQLREILEIDDKALQVNKILLNLEEEVDMQSAALHSRVEVAQQPRTVEIDGTYEADRFLVRIDGFPVRLTGKSFKYLAKLAWSRVNDATGWMYKEDIEVGFNQARYLYRMKNEISASFRSAWPVIENNRLGYYRLQIEPGKIRLNVDNLKTHPDYELRSLFESHPGAVN